LLQHLIKRKRKNLCISADGLTYSIIGDEESSHVDKQTDL